MGVSAVCFVLFIFLKQFYLFPSGSIGVGDVFLAISFLSSLAALVREKKGICLYRQDKLLYVFLFCVVVINGVYAVSLRNLEFVKYTIFWLYNGAAIWVFRRLSSQKFYVMISRAMKLNIVLQLAIYLLGAGRQFHVSWGGARYMGTFNDPNQFAFFVFMMLLMIYLCGLERRDRSFPVFYVLAVCLILVSKSTGVFAGVLVFTLGIILGYIWAVYKKSQIPKGIWCGMAAAVVAVGLLGVWYIWPSDNFSVVDSDYGLIARIQEKIWKFSNGSFADFLYDRSMEKLVLYPKYLIYGAGEGCYERFVLGDFVQKISPNVFDGEVPNEIHSSLFSVWFCYGIVPLVILILWLRQNWKGIKFEHGIAIAAILIESFFLMNCRQTFFWIILIFGNVLAKKDEVLLLSRGSHRRLSSPQ